jgi:hypothetical protein
MQCSNKRSWENEICQARKRCTSKKSGQVHDGRDKFCGTAGYGGTTI